MALVTGGASCGKSTLAEALCMGLEGSRVYLAAMRPFGREGEERVKRHRAQRAGKGFTTIECYEDFGKVADDPRIEGATVLLECLGNVVANDLFDEGCPSGAACIADAVCSIGVRLRDQGLSPVPDVVEHYASLPLCFYGFRDLHIAFPAKV